MKQQLLELSDSENGLNGFATHNDMIYDFPESGAKGPSSLSKRSVSSQDLNSLREAISDQPNFH
jgi:hypothetical protein